MSLPSPSSLSLPARAFAGALAVFTWASLVFQLVLALEYSLGIGRTLPAALGVYFGYFTILTNGLVALAASFGALAPASPAGRWLLRPRVSGGITAAIVLVGLGHHFLLRAMAPDAGPQWLADTLLHYCTPPAWCLWWWWAARSQPLASRDVALWCGYPVGYFVMTLLRGAVTGLYPYPFLELPVIGLERTLVNAFALLGVFAATGYALVALDRLARRASHLARSTSQPQ
ncbi:Pr6Pr family membrane protein [Derxia gummosa]|uniref:Pr6Pr family membrane protein n=1 Tax=Derxia gummosa DSM 723 TaxID=1121388 RepID=A0A8B6X9K2_9BURK|nr:Pr6Pr family membrane protein [Derxia gummosa]